jgi:hypothetical protein
VAYVAEQIGDSIDTVQGVYLHVVEELLGQPLAACGVRRPRFACKFDVSGSQVKVLVSRARAIT